MIEMMWLWLKLTAGQVARVAQRFVPVARRVGPEPPENLLHDGEEQGGGRRRGEAGERQEVGSQKEEVGTQEEELGSQEEEVGSQEERGGSQ